MLSNNTTEIQSETQSDDATWILTSAFIVFTMQSGFGLLEAGMVSSKNEANIMIKNAVDVVFGGLAYWLFGYGFSFGVDGNSFIGFGSFLTDTEEEKMGSKFSKYIFQMSFSTTATTIVSGAMAERTRLRAYMVFSFLNTLTFSLPCHWIWSEQGFLAKMGAVDIAGGAAVHIVGGVSSLVATLILKPRHRRFDPTVHRSLASAPSVVLGTFMLWWGWLGFNCGSTFGISGTKWQYATRAAVVTINGSTGGAIIGIIYSYSRTKYNGCLHVPVFTTGILGGLVGVTAICTLCRPWEALLIGAIGGALAVSGEELLSYFKIDDPVGCISTHFFAGVWSVLSVSLFAKRGSYEGIAVYNGIFRGGPWKFIGIQAITIFTISVWTAVASAVILLAIDCTIGLRMALHDEMIGADIAEHDIHKINIQELLGNASKLKELREKQSDHPKSEYNPFYYGWDEQDFIDFNCPYDYTDQEKKEAARNIASLLKCNKRESIAKQDTLHF